MSALASKLLAAQKAMPRIALDGTNNHFGNRYPSLGGVIDTVKPVLWEQSLTLTQPVEARSDGTAIVISRITDVDTGEFVDSSMPLVLVQNNPQAQGSAITYARRYTLLSLLALVGDADDDGNQASRVAASAATNQPSSSSAGDATDAPVTQADRPAPGAASAFQPPANAAQSPHHPNKPVKVGDTKSGDPIFECVSHVATVDGPNDKGWFQIGAPIDGMSARLDTKLEKLANAARELVGTSVVLRWSESTNGQYVNRRLERVEQAEGVEQIPAMVGGLPPIEDIPFGPVIW